MGDAKASEIQDLEQRDREGYLRMPQAVEEILLWDSEIAWLDD